jgi:signal transduction histidine kinase
VVNSDELRVEAERGRRLVEESREIVFVLDAESRVVAASRRAREAIDGLVEGALFPERVLEAAGRAPLEVPYEVDGQRETLVYLSAPGDLAAYEELRAGFTAAVSHELRTPLARLLALLESASLPDADVPALVAQSRAEVERIGELIDDVLFISELESGRAVVSLGSARALPVLEQVFERLADRAHDADVTLVLDCPASALLPLRQRMLETVAKNLTENAIRHAGPGATFTLSVRESDDGVVLDAGDDGRGVSETDLSRLFERFYRGDRTRSSSGSGLGLAIVKHIVTAAGGSVEAAAPEGRGLVIHCVFPTNGRA